MQKTITLESLAKLTNATLVGDPNHVITSVADLESATAQDISFLSNPRYEQSMLRSSAGAVFVPLTFSEKVEKPLLLVQDPSMAFQKAIEYFFEGRDLLTGFAGVHPTAVIHPTAALGLNVTIGPYVVIDQDVQIGDRTQILAGTTIGPFTSIGSDCLIHSHVTIRERCLIGNHVILQPGSVIGSCGFGYITDKQGKHIKLDQMGTVTIEDDVEIGANSTIDRSRFKTTKIGRGTKIDNLVQIGHGVIIGPGNILVSQTGIAGSSETGSYVVMGGQVGVSGHIKIADGVQIAAKAGISKSLSTKGGKYSGHPAVSLDEYNRRSVHLRNIEKYVEKIKALEERIKSTS